MAIIDLFDRGWSANPDGIAYIAGDRTYGFDEIGRLSCRIANALLDLGLPTATKGAVLAGNDPIAWTCVLGLWRAGFAWVPVNPRNGIEANIAILDDFDCEVLFFQAAFAPVIEQLKTALPKIKNWVCVESATAGCPPLGEWIDGRPDAAPFVEHHPDGVVAVMPTGGTTGKPKGVMNTNRSFQTFAANFMITCSYRADEPVVNLAAAPMTHTAGVLSLPCSARGGTVVVLTKPEPAALLDVIEQHRVTELFLPPTVIYRLLDEPGLAGRDFSSLRYFISGAAPLSIDKLKQAIAVFGPVMMQGYGQTEAPASIAMLRPEEYLTDGKPAGDLRLSACGRPTPMVRVAILDQHGADLPTGKPGEICVTGDLVMKGYYNDPEQTANTIVGGWLHTGDIGYQDAEGYLHITDRSKDMIITGGFNVYPSEIEQVIWGHPAVRDCSVIGVPDDDWGEAVKAVVELHPGESVDPAALVQLCKDKLGSIKAPKTVDLVDSLPRSPVGKVLKSELRSPYWSGHERRI
ncbi:AMP-binding protein [Actinoplanes sp. NPDC049118]|uniref:AMP-binding protein n=1 Tax=Actinoplanes sp. NPDC049118 TaxID=3155769 RepID=UPI0033CB0587